ncbi:UNVERIFIED_CONTAM: SWI/SNF complex component SNF12 [Sesamum calycinum]|uniref:SWI/SNF complex component SNF12 n=1 Tax=Sesamum calycinum TaxID=2727403 RepID=A0AAW2SYH3_9LAMI
MVSQKITPHLTPPGPIHLEHRVKLSGASPVGNTCYDVLVDVPLSVEDMSTFLANLEKNKSVTAEFINALIASQARDLKLASADASREVEKAHRAEFYNQPWIEDAVIRYLNRKPAVGSDAGNK